MENLTPKTNEEIEKIVAGDKDACDLALLVYLRMREEAILYGLPRIGSSRDKEEEVYKWRYATNKATWHEMCLLQRKAVVLQDRIDEIEKLKNRNQVAYEAQAGKLAKLKEERDHAKAEFYTNANKYAEIYQQCKHIETLDIDLRDLKLSATDIMEFEKQLNDEERAIFWKKYFDFADKFTAGPKSGAPSSGKGTMGE